MTDLKSIGECPDCGKIRYRDRKTAKRAAKSLFPGNHLSAYKCGDYWHFGNIPYSVVALGNDRRTVNPPRKREQARRRNARG